MAPPMPLPECVAEVDILEAWIGKLKFCGRVIELIEDVRLVWCGVECRADESQVAETWRHNYINMTQVRPLNKACATATCDPQIPKSE
jgi:hypothetical protein